MIHLHNKIEINTYFFILIKIIIHLYYAIDYICPILFVYYIFLWLYHQSHIPICTISIYDLYYLIFPAPNEIADWGTADWKNWRPQSYLYKCQLTVLYPSFCVIIYIRSCNIQKSARIDCKTAYNYVPNTKVS